MTTPLTPSPFCSILAPALAAPQHGRGLGISWRACRVVVAALVLLAAAPLATAADDDDGNPKLPSGKLTMTDEGSVLTLDNGDKFISKTENGEDILLFPNGQKFTSETGKSGGHGIWVSTDGTLVAANRNPATKTGMLYLYVKGADGKFTEVPDVNTKVSKLLEGVKGPWSEAALDYLSLREMKGHTLTLHSVYYDGEYRKHPFQVKVAPDGGLTLVKPAKKKQK